MDFETISIALFPVLFGMVLVWFVLVKLLFNRLEQAHPQTYEAMGRPSLFLRNSPAGAIAMLKFLARREHLALKDSYLSKLSDSMLVFFAIYLVLFIGLVVLMLGQGAGSAAAAA